MIAKRSHANGSKPQGREDMEKGSKNPRLKKKRGVSGVLRVWSHKRTTHGSRKSRGLTSEPKTVLIFENSFRQPCFAALAFRCFLHNKFARFAAAIGPQARCGDAAEEIGCEWVLGDECLIDASSSTALLFF